MSQAAKIPICHVQLLPLLSGVQRVSLQIFDVLDRDRFEPHVVLQGPGPFGDELRERGIRVHHLPNLVRPIHPLRDALAYRDLKRLFRAERFQVVHTHCSKPGILGRIAARNAGVPLILHHVHSIAFHHLAPTPVRAFYGRSERFAAGYGDRTVFVNHADRHDSIRRRLVTTARSTVIYNGTDLHRFHPRQGPRFDSPLRRSVGLGRDGMLIYFVARLERPKQPVLLAEIAAELDRMLPEEAWKLVIAGEGSYRRTLERKITRLGIGHRIRLVGWHDETAKAAAYQEADVVLQPSLWEGLSLTLIEAQASGLPCVVGDVSGNREVVVDRTGWRCAPSDAEDYARRLEWLFRRPEVRRVMGSEARKHAERNFDVETNMRAVAKLYDAVDVKQRQDRPRRLAA